MGGTPHLGWMKDTGDGFVCTPYPHPAKLLSPSICGRMLSELREAKRVSPTFLLFQEVWEFVWKYVGSERRAETLILNILPHSGPGSFLYSVL